MVPQVLLSYKFDPFASMIYKLWYEGKYIVLKCKTLRRSTENINSDLNRFFKAYGKVKDKDNDNDKFYQHVFDYASGDQFIIEPILIDKNPYQLLKCEYLELKKGELDPDCLNKPPFYPYISKLIQSGKGNSWISRGHYLNFRMWEKRLNQKKPA